MKHRRMKWVWMGVFVVGLAGTPLRTAAAPDPVGSAAAMQNTFADVAAKAIPAVVVITNKQIERLGPMYPNLPPELQFFFGIPQQPRAQRRMPRNVRQVPKPVGKGSGIIIRSNGYILTNYHVVKDADALEVRLHDGRIFDNTQDKKQVRIVGVDKETDLAVLQIGNGKVKDLPILEFADSAKIRVGDWAIAVGAPFNLDYSVSVGVVSQKGRYDLQMNTYENYIQTDASINPGNSGGPLLNIYGKVIGINDFIVTGGASRGSVGLGFAIDSDLARQVADGIIAHGHVVRPWLGIAMQPLTEALKKQFGVQKGVLVSEVLSGDPADKAGVKAGDVIMKVGDKEVRTPHDVQFAVLAYKPGDKIRLLIDRGGKRKTVSVVAREKEAGKETASIHSQDDLLNKLGMALEAGDEGVVVMGVVQGSPADIAQIQRGDVIVQVNRKNVKTVDDVVKALSKSRNGMAVFYIDRRGSKFFVAVPLTVGNK